MQLNKDQIHFYEKLQNSLKKRNKKGVYVFGDVGRGKTMLCQQVFNTLDEPKKYFHIEAFMLWLYKKIHHQKNKNPLKNIAQNFPYKVLFLDEFHLFDVGSVAILREFLLHLDAFVITTSNDKPDQLYANAKNRKPLQPLIDYLNVHFDILHLKGTIDYRRQKTKPKQTPTFHNLNPTNSITILGREIEVIATDNHTLLAHIEKLCGLGRASGDYLALAQQYKTIVVVVDNIIDDISVLRNFIKLVDIYYDMNLKIIIQSKLSHIISAEFLDETEKLTDRLLSRLQAMQN